MPADGARWWAWSCLIRQQRARPPGAWTLQAAPTQSYPLASGAVAPPAQTLLSTMLRRGCEAMRRFSTGQVSPATASVQVLPRDPFQTSGLEDWAAALGMGSDVYTAKAETKFLKLGDYREWSG